MSWGVNAEGDCTTGKLAEAVASEPSNSSGTSPEAIPRKSRGAGLGKCGGGDCPTGSSGSTSSGPSDELDTITAGKGGRGGECDAAAGTSPGVANAGDDIRRATRRPRLTEAGGPNP